MRQLTAIEFDETRTNFHVSILWDEDQYVLKGIVKDWKNSLTYSFTGGDIVSPVLVAGDETFVLRRIVYHVIKGESIELPFDLTTESYITWTKGFSD